MRRSRSMLAGAMVAAFAAACGGEAKDVPADTISARQRDSMIGASSLPGAGGVRGALGAQDSAAARNRQLDSLGAP